MEKEVVEPGHNAKILSQHLHEGLRIHFIFFFF